MCLPWRHDWVIPEYNYHLETRYGLKKCRKCDAFMDYDKGYTPGDSFKSKQLNKAYGALIWDQLNRTHHIPFITFDPGYSK